MNKKINVSFYLSTDEIEAIIHYYAMLEPDPMKFKLSKRNINKNIKSFLYNHGLQMMDDATWSYENSENYELVAKIQDAVNRYF